MRLKKLTARNFIAQQEFSHEFVEPITIFAAPNDTGKTTLRDALCVAWSGQTRGIPKNLRSKLARGPEGFEVSATTEIDGRDFVFSSTTTGDTPAPTDRAKWLGGKDLIHHITDYRAWELVGKDKRHKLLNSIVPQEAWRGTALPLDLETVREERGIHACMTAATNQRRGMKKQMADYGTPEKPDPVVLIEGFGHVDLRTRKAVDLQSEITELKKKARFITGQLTKAVILTESGEEREKHLNELAAKIPKLEADQKAARERRVPLNQAATTAGTQRSIAENDKTTAKAMLAEAQRMVDIGEECGVCGNKLDKDQIDSNAKHLADCKENFEGYATDYHKALTDWEEANACAARAKQDELDLGVLLKEARNAEKELVEHREQIEAAKAEGLDYSKLEVDLENNQTHRDGLVKMEAAVNNLEWQQQQYDTTMGNLERMQNRMKTMEDICASIEDNVKGGSRDVLAVCEKHIKSIGDVYGYEIRLADDYMPGMNGIPFQLLCESNQYLCLVAVQYALALVSGIGFMFIDSLDRLTPERLKMLREWMQVTVVGSGVQIVAAVARDEPKAVRKSPFHVVPLATRTGARSKKLD